MMGHGQASHEAGPAPDDLHRSLIPVQCPSRIVGRREKRWLVGGRVFLRLDIRTVAGFGLD